jgi:ribosomal protein L20
VGSNPTPRAYLGDLYDSFKSNNKADTDRKTNLARHHFLGFKEQQQENDSLIIKRINLLTRSCTKLYFNRILKKLANTNIQNANTICDYIIAEET